MFGFKSVKRDQPLTWSAPFIFLIALGLSLALCALLLAVQGKPPFKGLFILWDGSFGHLWALEDALLKSVPLFLCSLGVAVCFRMQIWNIGAEGQFALGAIGATGMALAFPELPWYGVLPLMFLGAAVLGGLWALIPAYLKLKLRMNEIITTLMLNYIAILILDYLVYGVWKDPVSYGFPMTPIFSEAAIIDSIGSTRMHWGMVLCVLVGGLMWVFLQRTRLGYELKASGEGPRAARYAHMPYGFLVLLVMGICGALAGWAGAMEASVSLNRLQPTIMAGYGYTAIIVAWLARLRITTIAFYSFLLAGLKMGVENLQLELMVPAAFGHILEGAILITILAGQYFQNFTFRKRQQTGDSVTNGGDSVTNRGDSVTAGGEAASQGGEA